MSCSLWIFILIFVRELEQLLTIKGERIHYGKTH